MDSTPRAIPAKFLYDARGSALFDAICELPEYYLTRTEIEILRRFEADIAAMAGPGCALVEYGSGSSVKSRLLIEAMRDLVAYVPIDISRQHLDATANGLRRDYPHLKVEPVCADYMTLARLPADVSAARRRIGFFPGSTIGNLLPVEATAFPASRPRPCWARAVRWCSVSISRRIRGACTMPTTTSAGVTAQFTLNLLRRMNRELEANFDLSAFAHEALLQSRRGPHRDLLPLPQVADRHRCGTELRLRRRRAGPYGIFLQVRRCRHCRRWRAAQASLSPGPGPIRRACSLSSIL